MKRKLFSIVMVFVLLLSLATSALAQEGLDRPLPLGVEGAKLDTPAEVADAALKLDRSLLTASGPKQVTVRLSLLPVAQTFTDGGTRATQRAQLNQIKRQQDIFIGQVWGMDPNLVVLGSVQRVLNAVMIKVDASVLNDIAALPYVESINPIIDYELDLAETVPYIGGTEVQNMGFTGEGIRVGVIDSGIDYNHAALGGSGDPADFAANDPTIIEPGTFPTAKVVGGYDWVGGQWPSGDLAPDPDPLDAGSGGGHGTHVAHIIGGVAVPGTDIAGGVAPDVELYALKVCSSVSTSCSGAAMLEALDFAVDPNGDGNLADHLDLVNMSIGSPYGQAYDDDTAEAVNFATFAGVLSVTSAGNSADKPFVTGTPGAAPFALSTAQTNVPSAVQPLMEVTAPASIAGLYPAVFQSWSAELTDVVEGPLQYGDGAGGQLLGCSLGADPNSTDPANAPFAPGSLAGKIVLVDRGVCNFSVKIYNIQQGGALAGIIGLVAPGDPFDGSLGAGGPFTIPGYMISQVDSNALKSGLPDTYLVFDPATGIPLVQHMVGSSSRGPSYWMNYIKPDIGAPGASYSAVAGSGTAQEPFGGTSGASPMVAGSAALLKDMLDPAGKDPFVPMKLKALLVQSAETEIMNTPEFFGGDLAAISRIGGGEVRVDRAAESDIVMWELGTFFPNLSFGAVDVTQGVVTLQKAVEVRNLTNQELIYDLLPTFRFEDDALNGAVQVITIPETLVVPPKGDGKRPEAGFVVRMTIDGTKLNEWTMNSGSQGANGDSLTANEFDGYLFLDNVNTSEDDDMMIHMPWHVLPRLSGNIVSEDSQVVIDGEYSGIPAGETVLSNLGVGPGYIDTYSLVGMSEDDPAVGGMGDQSPVIDLQYVAVQTYPVPAGYCSADESFVMSFVVTTWDRYAHAIVPAAFEIYLDTDQDGVDDFVVINWDTSGPYNITDGRNLTWAFNLTTGRGNAFFYTDHSVNSNTFVMSICGEQIGMNAANFGEFMDMDVLAWDSYFTGNYTDAILDMTVAPLGERYLGGIDYFGGGDIASGASSGLIVLDFGAVGTNPTESGILLVNNAARSGGIHGGAPKGNEVLYLPVVAP